MLYNQASFKNSRIASRKPTTVADTFQLVVGVGANTLISPANPNRTYLTLRSTATASGDDLRYDYFDNPNILTEGFLLKAGEAVDLESPQTIYARGVANPVTATVDQGEG
jgi:hypothetical protein